MTAMIISKVGQFNNLYRFGFSTNKTGNPTVTYPTKTKEPVSDVFVKNSDNVSFTGAKFSTYDFEKKFTRTFFKKIAKEHVPDAYSDIDFLIPGDEFENLKSTGAFTKKGLVAIKLIEPYKNCMFKIEKEVFVILENLSKKHPNLNLQELLRLKYPSAEKTLIHQQSEVLDKLSLTARDILPSKEFQQLREIINQAFDQIFAQDPLPEDIFRRKNFLLQIKKMDIADTAVKNKLLALAEKLPGSDNSVNAFIVKYSQPYKVRWDAKTESLQKIPRDSEEIGERLLKPSVNTDDHIYPQKAFRKEQEDRLNGKKYAKDLSTLRVTLLCSRKMNEEKTDILFDDYAKMTSQNLSKSIQRQVDKLIKIIPVWLRQGKVEDAKLLSEYIQVLRDELALRSKIVKLDTTELDKILPTVNSSYNVHIDRLQSKKSAKQKKRTSTKRTDRAANNHKDSYVSADGRVMQNRKTQTHFSKFSH
jgi:hypothetical protein